MNRSSLGLESGVVRLVPYDPAWADLFLAESASIEAMLRKHNVIAVLEHIGSTSVPGLAAKPILDTLVGVEHANDFIPATTALVEAGYNYRGEQGIPGRHFFRRGEPRQYHVHLVVRESDLWRDYLAFRDFLRTHPDRVTEYAALKHALAKRYPRDREAYIEGKTEFVRRILAHVRSKTVTAPTID